MAIVATRLAQVAVAFRWGNSERLMKDLLKLRESCLIHAGGCDPVQLAIHDFAAGDGAKAP
ncbi:MAG TPA: hypothetical protein VEV85_00855 [Bryobacteraceae bacterium]|nr:hypothetical protein [Bryobacteraceae bacterium]